MAQDNPYVLSPEDLALKVAGDTLAQQQAYMAELMKLPELPTSAWDIMQASKSKYDLNKALSLADRNSQLNRAKALAEQASIQKMIALEDQTGVKIDPTTGKGQRVTETLIPLSAWKGYQEYQKAAQELLKTLNPTNSEAEDKARRAMLFMMSQTTGQRWGDRPIDDWQKRLLYKQGFGGIL